jgi:hypothetical protein
MLALYHNITVRKRRVSKQRLQIQQRTAADRRHGRQAHTAAGHRIEHPLRNLQEPNSWVLIHAASAHSSTIPDESFVDRYSAGVPRMPRVTDFSRFDIMGVALSTRTTKTGHIWDSRRIRRQVGLLKFALSLEARFNPYRDSAGCTIVMRWQRKLESDPSD